MGEHEVRNVKTRLKAGGSGFPRDLERFMWGARVERMHRRKIKLDGDGWSRLAGFGVTLLKRDTKVSKNCHKMFATLYKYVLVIITY